MPKKKEQKMYNTALYIRLSKADERKGRERFSESIENQKIILHEHLDTCVRLPMNSEARSLNLSNTVAIATYEILRQWNYPNLLCEGQLTKFNW